ncbi:cystatin-like protein [Biomphalaria glabrata]|uniref:Cystatin-like protein n=1 Tax=Biomphalaria glabrata TaxID=6526 RepID=A0A9W2ZW55_BIOGL|nr:cystatin-like protein [Biomphalaria glabrata]
MKSVLLLMLTVAHCTSASSAGSERQYETTLLDPYVVFAMTAINDYFCEKGDDSPRAALRLVKATCQLVAGNLYRFIIEVSGGQTIDECTVKVWSRPWLPKQEATKTTVLDCVPKI